MAARKSATAASRKKPAEKSGLNGGITDFDKSTELEAYREMLMIRRFEEKAGQLYGMGFIGGFCHLYIGQEAVVIGMQMALKDGDQVITGYRDHGSTTLSRTPAATWRAPRRARAPPTKEWR